MRERRGKRGAVRDGFENRYTSDISCSYSTALHLNIHSEHRLGADTMCESCLKCQRFWQILFWLLTGQDFISGLKQEHISVFHRMLQMRVMTTCDWIFTSLLHMQINTWKYSVDFNPWEAATRSLCIVCQKIKEEDK